MKLSLMRFKWIACLVIAATFSLSITLPAAQARMINTGQALSQEEATGDRARLQNFLEREDIQQILIDQGFSPEHAKQRVATLTDDEVRQAVTQMDQLPAGGGAVGTIVGAIVIIFVVLLVTDILGLTRVFPFTRPLR